MKKTLLASALAVLAYSNTKACADYYADGYFFNLFTQSIIRDKAYLPFLRTDNTWFYEGPKVKVVDDNIVQWQKYFGSRFNYDETEYLVNHMPLNDLQQYKNGSSANALLNRIGAYGNFKEGIDYLIEAKYLEPFMRINYVESPDTFYRESNETQNATLLNYDRTVSALISLYNDAKSPEIKARYGYQLVRFNHYTRNYQKAIDAFKTYVEPLKVHTAPYWLALDQMAGAQRGLNMGQEANWNFFQVFSNSNTRKESAFVSMKLSDSASFKSIMERAQTPEEKNMAYFLLGYQDFNNPLPAMEKMYDIDPNSEILKVMAARSINEIERDYLPLYYSTYQDNDINTSGSTAAPAEKSKTAAKSESGKISLWDKIVSFFKNLFSSKKSQSETPKTAEEKAKQTDDDLLENPNRIPFFRDDSNSMSDETTNDYSEELLDFIEKTKGKSNDEFWAIAEAYMKFLKKDYKGSSDILNSIKTGNAEYIDQINRLKMLNDITAQPKIDAAFEDHMMKAYPTLFTEKPKSDSTDYFYETPGTEDFIRDVLANRYFLQGEDGKSFLMNNNMSDLQYSPNSSLVKKVEEYCHKPNKTTFEKTVVDKNIDIDNPDSFFSIIYGDGEMRNGNFSNAKTFYAKVQNFKGVPRDFEVWDEKTQTYRPFSYDNGSYNGFDNISPLVFGHNVWESFHSAESESMVAENFINQFPFITKMNKLQLADALLRLQEMAKGKDAKAAQANQLIGNLLYNTSSLGYFRQLFVMDVDNSNGGKYNFDLPSAESPYQVYYKDFTSHTFIKPDNFDLSINYYQKALDLTADREGKARILFQMASAEQGKYYQWVNDQNRGFDYSDPQWDQKEQAFQDRLAQNKNAKFRTYFTKLKTQFADTQTAQGLMGSCSYYNYFMKK